MNHKHTAENSSFWQLRTRDIKALLFLTCILLSQITAKATSLIHDWQENHRGYSIELIPGTGENNIDAEYVAAGTVYDQVHAYPGWHFMHLDNTGNILAERTSWAKIEIYHEFRVVDIACQSANEFWITIQARNRTSAVEIDYIYLAGVDATGNDLATNPAIALVSSNATHKNLYPTHSYFANNGYLYLCGYAADGTEYPNEPDNVYSDKYGMFLKVDVATATASSYFWNTGYANGKDYDMPLRIAPYGYGQTFPLLVTGSLNTSDEWLSGILVAKFASSGLPLALNGLIPTVYAYTPITPDGEPDSRPWGPYGVDIRGGVYGGSGGELTNPDIIVLVNYFDSRYPDENTFGILRAKDDLSAYGTILSPVLSYKYISKQGAWGSQFLELHGYGSTGMTDNHIAIVGEKVSYSLDPDDPTACSKNITLPTGSIAPSLVNVNPFIDHQSFGNGYWDFTTGFNTSITIPLNQRIYLTSEGTSAANMDYLNGSLGATAAREDVTRLYTFASLGKYYDDPSIVNPYRFELAMVSPIAEDPTTAVNPNLRTKYLGLTPWPDYEETDCENTVPDCPRYQYSDVSEVYNFTSELYNGPAAFNGYTIFTLTNQFNNIPSDIPCDPSGGGLYKKATGIATTPQANNIQILPNPASDKLILNLGINKGKYHFMLTDITGKTVVSKDGKADGSDIKISLPVLSSGLYLARVTVNDVTHVQKLNIQQ